ncbi:hypothetical protein B5M09_013197 [Aphanomyces astaci]|uniref:DUF6818 domain-containing protein n=1 Tax=Aphanomyces astaci TaxID=112090 RepID=A0A3R7YJR8_APHAT|nr:hypothetical protein B5M09_013197 [Aphanomyces astaci]
MFLQLLQFPLCSFDTALNSAGFQHFERFFESFLHIRKPRTISVATTNMSFHIRPHQLNWLQVGVIGGAEDDSMVLVDCHLDYLRLDVLFNSWCPASVDLLLDITVDVLPLGKNGWEKMERRFNRLAEPKLLPIRDADALKRKFLLLKNHAKPTGDPDCPEEVQRAKRIRPVGVSAVSRRRLRRRYMLINLNLSTTMQPSVPTCHEDDEDVGRTGLPCSELQLLSDKLKRGRDPSDVAGGLLSYTAKKRRSIDKFIDGAADADAKASSDMMTLFLLMDERAAKREVSRIERQEKYDREREVREARREEMHRLLMSKMLEHNQ